MIKLFVLLFFFIFNKTAYTNYKSKIFNKNDGKNINENDNYFTLVYNTNVSFSPNFTFNQFGLFFLKHTQNTSCYPYANCKINCNKIYF